VLQENDFTSQGYNLLGSDKSAVTARARVLVRVCRFKPARLSASARAREKNNTGAGRQGEIFRKLARIVRLGPCSVLTRHQSSWDSPPEACTCLARELGRPRDFCSAVRGAAPRRCVDPLHRPAQRPPAAGSAPWRRIVFRSSVCCQMCYRGKDHGGGDYGGGVTGDLPLLQHRVQLCDDEVLTALSLRNTIIIDWGPGA
jgi:hypothetical protein